MRNFHFAGRSTVHAQNAMVATSHPAAALVAVDVMRAGGTAADAAVAACALLGVIEPQSTGIGGDCFALIQPKGEGKIVAYNGSGRAPMAAKVEWYLERKINSVPLTSAHAVSIPGAIDAWATILRDHGKLGFDTLLQPAIKAAEEGYIVAPRIAFDWKNQFEKLKNGTNTERYLLPHGKPAAGSRSCWTEPRRSGGVSCTPGTASVGISGNGAKGHGCCMEPATAGSFFGRDATGEKEEAALP